MGPTGQELSGAWKPCSSGFHCSPRMGAGEGSDEAVEKMSDSTCISFGQHRPCQARGTDRSLALPRGPFRDLEHHMDRAKTEPENAPDPTEQVRVEVVPIGTRREPQSGSRPHQPWGNRDSREVLTPGIEGIAGIARVDG
jgi:hypothetical protein